jgi:hypothetical protein
MASVNSRLKAGPIKSSLPESPNLRIFEKHPIFLATQQKVAARYKLAICEQL